MALYATDGMVCNCALKENNNYCHRPDCDFFPKPPKCNCSSIKKDDTPVPCVDERLLLLKKISSDVNYLTQIENRRDLSGDWLTKIVSGSIRNARKEHPDFTDAQLTSSIAKRICSELRSIPLVSLSQPSAAKGFSQKADTNELTCDAGELSKEESPRNGVTGPDDVKDASRKGQCPVCNNAPLNAEDYCKRCKSYFPSTAGASPVMILPYACHCSCYDENCDCKCHKEETK